MTREKTIEFGLALFKASPVYRIQNGKIVKEREELDMLGGMIQLGLELKPKEGKK